MDGLSLIDVSSEDDCLLFSSFLDPNSNAFPDTGMDGKVLGFFSNEHDYKDEIPVSTLEEKEQVLKQYQSPEPEKVLKDGKYNLRKSLAWDNAFFTSAGVLDPEELSSIIESNKKCEKQMLSTIQEDVHGSTESLQSDSIAGESCEPFVFEDIRASIQRSSKSFDAATPNNRKESEAAETAPIPSSSKTEHVSHDKMKPRAGPRKLGIGAQGLGKTAKQVSLRPPVAQSVAIRGGWSASVSKPPNGLSSVSPMSTTSTKRASLDVNRVKQQKDAKSAGGKGAPSPKLPILGSTRNILPKPLQPSKSSLRSSRATNTELTSSCSSFESCASASSSSSHRSYLNSIKKKNDSSARSPNPSTVAARTTSKVAPRGIGQPRKPHLSTKLMSKGKLSPNTSPASSISEWSSESSTASTLSERAKSYKANGKTTSFRNPAKDEAPHTLNCENNSDARFSVGVDARTAELAGEGAKQVPTGNGGLINPASVKPTGLRMPSPKIGFFDGVKVVRTPTGNVQPRPSVISSLPRPGGRSPSGSSSGAKSGKLQSARSLPETSNIKTKAANVSRSPTTVSGSSPKVVGGKQVKAEGNLRGASGEIKHRDITLAGKRNSPASVKNKVSPGSQSTAQPKNVKMMLSEEKPETLGEESTIPPTTMVENGVKKEKIVEDQVDKSTKDGGVELNDKMESKNEVAWDALSLASQEKRAVGVVENTSGKKMPLADNNSYCKENGIITVSTGLAVVDVADKVASLPAPENIPAAYSLLH